MAHRYKIEEKPHKNNDGTTAKRKKDYIVVDRHKSGRREVGIATSKQGAQELIASDRDANVRAHLAKNPGDRNFVKKHNIRAVREGEI